MQTIKTIPKNQKKICQLTNQKKKFKLISQAT